MLLSFFRKFINSEENEDNFEMLQLTSMPESQEMIRKYTKLVITELDPDELVIFEKELESFFKNPLPPKKSGFQKDNPLGAGDIFGEMSSYTQPVALAIFSVIFFTYNSLKRKDKKAIRKVVVERVKDLLSTNSLTKEQAKEYKSLIIMVLDDFPSIPNDEKKKIAEIIIAKFFMQE